MWVRFTGDFDFSPAALGGRSTTAYRAGMELNVTRECADLAVAKGKAVRGRKPRKGALFVEQADGETDRR
ncbi:MAG: hypothetical protein EOS73_16025 [Mesorhizobium sp.]|uniref:hypothetical protein n=1 Tax=Mesorhizobium sp. M7A.F.Ca.ET.027.02.1.1 TaxID=2496655 RepID=UPI000FD3A812|nr:hypothetical protein [Mesorhizobium sp. M7A.F.Ca.ET.027.02.1.1]RVD15370.1 hypothetical protein EN749_16225 [Mesorhizobium sp. M7A.F.Ca.ET.027.02.1.1]RWD08189.1 MAG: hypothetical protein EOS73_16025 [Mesorhizobium sp.]